MKETWVFNIKSVVLVFLVLMTWGSADEKIEFPELGHSQKVQSKIKEVIEKKIKVHDFWNWVKKEKTPYVERVEGDSSHFHVTFFWKGNDETRNVLLLFSTLKVTQNLYFKKVENTNIWWRTLKLPRGMRNSYMLSINDEKGLGYWSHRKEWQNDPFNPMLFLDDPGGQRGPYSCLVLPGAEPFPFKYDEVYPDTLKGSSKEFTIESQYLKQKRRFWVVTPPGYKKEKGPYPFVVHFDGGTFLNQFPRKAAVDNMMMYKDIPHCIVIYIEQIKRSQELRANDDFVNFVVKEALELTRKEYHLSQDPKRSIIAGTSNGGRAASYIALKHPDIFGKVLSQSGNYGGRDGDLIVEAYRQSKKKEILHYLVAGTLEQKFYQRNIQFMKLLDEKGYPYHFEENVGSHTYFSRQGSFVRGMRFLLK